MTNLKTWFYIWKRIRFLIDNDIYGNAIKNENRCLHFHILTSAEGYSPQKIITCITHAQQWKNHKGLLKLKIIIKQNCSQVNQHFYRHRAVLVFFQYQEIVNKTVQYKDFQSTKYTCPFYSATIGGWFFTRFQWIKQYTNSHCKYCLYR